MAADAIEGLIERWCGRDIALDPEGCVTARPVTLRLRAKAPPGVLYAEDLDAGLAGALLGWPFAARVDRTKPTGGGAVPLVVGAAARHGGGA